MRYRRKPLARWYISSSRYTGRYRSSRKTLSERPLFLVFAPVSKPFMHAGVLTMATYQWRRASLRCPEAELVASCADSSQCPKMAVDREMLVRRSRQRIGREDSAQVGAGNKHLYAIVATPAHNLVQNGPTWLAEKFGILDSP
jgi:hypothetical protein